jgi:hypothetical protein
MDPAPRLVTSRAAVARGHSQAPRANIRSQRSTPSGRSNSRAECPVWYVLGGDRMLAAPAYNVTLIAARSIQGTGDTRSPLYITLVSQVVLPVGICATLQSLGRLEASGVWTAILVGHVVRCALSVARFHQGRWKHIAVDIEEVTP